ncbi:MAG: hypothetical protein EOO29_14200 [Comamonadaceae bacterium]|nr:MAG: hypothetical protein EOO29_14200 [Comamonadaceae bacterium]
MRMLNALEAGTLSGAQLDTLIGADASRLGELRVLLRLKGQLNRIQASNTTLTGLAGSGHAWGALRDVAPEVLPLLLNSSAAMAAAAVSAPAAALIAQDAGLAASVIGNAVARAAMLGATVGAEAFVASTPAMNALIASQPSLNLIFADPAKLAAFKASTALTASAIPAMTSASSPAGLVSSSTGTLPWQAMDKNSVGTQLTTTANTNQWIRYSTTGVNRYIHTLRIWAAFSGTTGVKNFRLEYSIDGTVWNTAFTGVYPLETGTNRSFDVNCAVAAQHWRLFLIDAHGGSVFTLPEVDMLGFVAP